jgi:hypothetical protein
MAPPRCRTPTQRKEDMSLLLPTVVRLPHPYINLSKLEATLPVLDTPVDQSSSPDILYW